ncbi:MAG: undecaprenyldiphospho-muramoylpentapeptide beta-N-acetylglucosaminyltransferase [Epsilonproteobacteria bacterium]|nr:undecaprenyldiphospho-muramoylpentapeptide beta-N-acetylglucosaminyltransferase [Campylobacterota bacterium]
MGSIAFSGGGTGGHLAIVKAVMEQVNSPMVYIGSTKGQDRDWFENEKRFKSRYFLETTGVMDKGGVKKIASLFNILKRVKEAREILKKEDVKVLFSVGGFSAAPAAIAAITLNIPLVIHEQNAYSGNLNRVLKPFAKAFISSYEKNDITMAYPTKEIYFKSARVRERIKTILIMGGSQGSVALNRFALEIAPLLKEKNIKIYHQAGVKNVDEVKEGYKELGVEAEVFGFSNNMAQIINEADFAISRAGASTLWEMVANGLPALFVPYPYAANDHQYYNAKFLADKELGWVVREKELNKKLLEDILDKDLSSISKELIRLAKPNGARDIAKYLEKFV